MDLIVRHIEYLMLDHDCVVVPGLGAFLAHRHGAAYDMETELFHSPGRNYAFNSELTGADGLMTMSVARALDSDSREASRRIEQGVDQIRRELDMAGSVAVGRLGHLVKNTAGILVFEPAEVDMLTPMADWMPHLAAKPVCRLHRQRSSVMAGKTREPRPGRFSRFVRTAVGAAAAVLIALVASTPVTVDNAFEASTKLPAIMMPRAVAPAHEVDMAVEAEVHAGVAVPDVVTAEENASQAPQAKAEENTEKKACIPLTPRFNELDEYIVVVASLANTDEVDRFIDQQRRANKNLQFGVVQSGRRHRVYVATGTAKPQAQAQARLVRDRFKDAWVARR